MVLATNTFTLADWQKGRDPNGALAMTVEVLRQKNKILDDIMFKEGNLTTGHQISVRTGYPTVTWVLLNAQTPATKSRKAQITETCGNAETWLEIAKKIADMGGNPNALLGDEAVAHIEAVSQEVASTYFYGNSALSPQEFLGLSARYADQSAEIGQNIIDGGGTGSDNASIWVIDWGAGIHGIFPKGMPMGLDFENYGEETKETTAGLSRVYRAQFQWHCGLAVPDWRAAVRVANIDISHLVAKTSATDISDMLSMAVERLPNDNPGPNARIYMNRTVRQMFRIQRRDDVQTGGQLSYTVVDGRKILDFDGIPVHICDALTVAEETVS